MRLSANILSKSENFYKSPSKFFLSLLLSFIVGVYFGHYYWFNLFWQGGLAIAFLGFCFLFAKSKKIVVLAYLGLFFILGAFYYQWREESHKRQLAEAKDLLGRGQFLAVVAREPDKYQNGQRLEIDLKLDDKTELTLGKALLFTDFYPKYYYGDLIKFSGKLSEVESFSDFDYKSYLVRQGIVGTSFNPKIEFIKSSQGNFWIRQIYKFKSRVEIVIDKILPRPESALLAGLLIGRRQDFSQELTKAMQATGTSHIAAISGYNITIVAKILSLVLIGFILKRQQAFYLITAGIIFFVILTGSQASVVRAGIMGFLVILATQVGRASRVTNALALSAFVMILLDPFILRFDVGFQLSFLATIGLIYASPVLERRLKFLPNKLEIRSSLANSLAAQILVLDKYKERISIADVFSKSFKYALPLFLASILTALFITGSLSMLFRASCISFSFAA